MIIGGSWSVNAENVRASYYNRIEPSYTGSYLGFGCAEFRPGS